MTATPRHDARDGDELAARRLDAEDPLAGYRARFCIPVRAGGAPVHYFCGNSLGLAPTAARACVEQELDDWERLAVQGHFAGTHPWYSYHESFRESGARLVGARSGEVVMMNTLTANLHLMMVSFYRPTRERHKILIEDAAFPSDRYAVETQLIHHGYDPATGVIVARPRAGEQTLRTSDIEALIDERGEELALVLFGGVNYFTGQAFDMERIARAARRHGVRVGFDLAHAAGNLVLKLHDWHVDFAVWCSYKYLNGSPGAVAGCFVHETHGRDGRLPRFGGWWGNDPATRFEMHRNDRFVPRAGADGWQVSNPPILSLAPLRASLELFDEAGMSALRSKSEQLTGYLEQLLDCERDSRFAVITPREPAARGCQLSIRVREGAAELHRRLEAEGVVCDFRRPDVIRVAPVPFYNTFHDVWTFAQVFKNS